MLDYEYICDRSAKFHKKILFITRVINIQIMTTKYFSFQYSVRPTYFIVRHSGVQPTEHVRQCICLLMRHQTSSFQLCGQPTVLTLTQSTTRFWWKLQDRVYRSQICDVDQLKSRLVEEWEHFHQVVIDEAVRQWRPCLRACVRLRAHGGHFEHRL